MSPTARIRIATLGLLFAGCCMALPALADSPVTVTFQPDSHWVQEVNTLDRYNYFRDYSVAIATGKTLQINLITRDPNVFFKVEDSTNDNRLVDTYKTGATTWSTSAAQPTTYTIHVYVHPDAMQRDEKPKYALQIGQYGAEDMQPASTPVTFEGNNPWAQEVGDVDVRAPAHDFTVPVAAGNTLQVNLITQNPDIHFKVMDQAGPNELVDTGKTAATTWSTTAATSQTYTVRVYADPTALTAGRSARYALQVGRYGAGNPQPAGATTASPTDTATSEANLDTATPTPASSVGH